MTNNVKHISLFGTHRVGKTSLAKLLSDNLEIQYIETGVSKLINDRFGITDIPSLEKAPTMYRLKVQEFVAEHLVSLYVKHPSGVFDRSIFDVMAYSNYIIFKQSPDRVDDATPDMLQQHIAYISSLRAGLDKTPNIVIKLDPIHIPKEEQNLAKSASWGSRDIINTIANNIAYEYGIPTISDSNIDDRLAQCLNYIGKFNRTITVLEKQKGI